MTTQKSAKTDRWKWIILIAAFLNGAVCSSIVFNCGVVNDALIETFGVDAVESSWLMAYYCSMFAIASPLASAVILLTDCRICVIMSGIMGLVGFASSSLVDHFPLLYLTFGLSGVATSLAQTGSVLTLSYYFPDNLPLVHGVCLAGTGMGSFIHPGLTQTFFDRYGFHGTMLMLAGMAFHTVVFGMLFRPNTLELKSKAISTNREQSYYWKIVRSKIIPPADIFRLPAFVFLIPTVFFFSCAFQSIIVILPSYFKRYGGLSIQEASLAAMVFGAGSVTSRLFSGVAASDENIGENILFTGMGGLLSLLTLCGKLIVELQYGAYIFSFAYALYAGGMFSLSSAMLMGIVGIELSAHGFGVVMLMFGIGGLTGPPLISWLVETQGPDMLFLSCGIISLLTTVLGLMTSYLGNGRNGITTTEDKQAPTRDMHVYVFPDDGPNKSDKDTGRMTLLETGNLNHDEHFCDENDIDNDFILMENRNRSIGAGDKQLEGDSPHVFNVVNSFPDADVEQNDSAILL